MAHRKQQPLLDDIFALLKITPVWFGPVLAIGVFASFRYLPAIILPPKASGADLGIVLRPLLTGLSWLFGCVVLLIWIAAEAFKLFNRNRLDRQTGIESIRSLSWAAFEELVAEAYRRQGYIAEVTGSPAGDGGVDIDLRGRGEHVLVQCKQWKAYTVGVRTVRELLGVVVSQKATRGVVATSGRFTREAKRFAEGTDQIELVDGAALTSLVAGVQGRQQTAHAPPPPMPRTTPLADTPSCPLCQRPMTLRTARRGANAGSSFWGCPSYPSCRGTRTA